MKRASSGKRDADNIVILHISDLHMTSQSDPEALCQPLIADINKTTGLNLDRLDYLVVSGDLSDRGSAEELDLANKLISGILSRFNISAERCIIVPGNHDVDWEIPVYKWKGRRPGDTSAFKARYVR